MKKRNHVANPSFAGKCICVWLLCWITYCACEFFMLRFFYLETMPPQRDYSVLFWTQHIVFAYAYYAFFTGPRLRATPVYTERKFRPLKCVGDFFRSDWRQVILLAGGAALYEMLQFVFPDTNDLFSAMLVMLFPSATVIPPPVARTVIALSISLASMILPGVAVSYERYRKEVSKKAGTGD